MPRLGWCAQAPEGFSWPWRIRTEGVEGKGDYSIACIRSGVYDLAAAPTEGTAS